MSANLNENGNGGSSLFQLATTILKGDSSVNKNKVAGAEENLDKFQVMIKLHESKIISYPIIPFLIQCVLCQY